MKQYLVMLHGAKKYITVVDNYETLNDLKKHLSSAPLVLVRTFGGGQALIGLGSVALATGPNDPSQMERTYPESHP